jgi:hypothetical protein
MDPAKLHPVYNAVVYVPSAALADIPTGPSCDLCGTPPSGSPVAVALSGADGSFTMSGVPSGTNIPLVVQIGKWRREGVVIPSVAACGDTAVDPELTRLPTNKSEGHLPHIAISTGLDGMECALQSIGVAASEFTDSTGNGSIHIYQGDATVGATAGTGTLPASSLWSSVPTLGNYDMVIDACQGAPPTDKPQASIDNINAYAAAGGRVYLSHWEDFVIWPTAENSTFSPSATEDTTSTSTATMAANVAINLGGFPKGAALGKWALDVGASTTLGEIAAINNARFNVLSVTSPSKSWLSGLVPPDNTTENVYEFSFYTGSAACGKVEFQDFHVSAGGQLTAEVFPAECTDPANLPDPGATDLFEFFLFDSLNCVQDDSQMPVPPPLH